MKKIIIVFLLLTVLGCQEAHKSDVSKTLKPVSPDWQKIYGDSEESQLYYNIVLCEAVLNQQSKTINLHKQVLTRIIDELNLYDPNLPKDPNEPNN